MACPSQVDKIRDVSTLEGTPIDQVFIGSCTNSRIEDLRAAAEVLRGKKLAPGVKAFVVPGSTQVRAQAEKEGIDLNTSDITFDTSIRIVEGSMDETSITSSQKLMVYVAAK